MTSLHFASTADSVFGVSHIDPVNVECASFGNSFGEFGRSPLSGDLHVTQRARRARLCSLVAKPNFPFSPKGRFDVGTREICHSTSGGVPILFEESSSTLQASGLVGETKNMCVLWPAGVYRCEQESSPPMVALRAHCRPALHRSPAFPRRIHMRGVPQTILVQRFKLCLCAVS